MREITRLIGSAIGLLLIALGISLVTVALLQKYVGADSTTYTPPMLAAEKVLFPSIVRLHDTEGRFFCSGVVISDKFVATANHCVDRSSLFGPTTFVDAVNVRPQDGRNIGLLAKVVGGNSRSDTAIITGDFSGFKKQPIISDVRLANSLSLNNNINLITCGFPWGDQLYCIPVGPRSYYNFAILTTALLYPGMSGGPVMIAETGEVVAVNTAAMGNNVILSPTGAIFTITGAKKE